MQALVIYESMFGNTEAVARAIADGLRAEFDVTVADVSGMPDARDADLIVIGGPTHAFGMSRPTTREDAKRQGRVRDSAVDVGIREWLECSDLLTDKVAAAFDTKVGKPFLPGSAARKAERHLRRLGCRIAARAESFRVGGTVGPLNDGEQDRARRWGAELAATVRGSRQPA